MILEFIGNAPRNNFLRLGVSGNNLVDDLVFIIGRKQGKNDLYEFTPKIKITTAEGDFAEYSGDDLTVEKIEERDTIKITYVLPEIVTERGNVDMQLVFEKEDSKGIKTWQTLMWNVTFPDSIKESNAIMQAYPNVIRELMLSEKKALNDSATAKTVSQEALDVTNDLKINTIPTEIQSVKNYASESAEGALYQAQIYAENIREQNKQYTDEQVAKIRGKLPIYVNDTEEKYIKKIPSSAFPYAFVNKIGGKTVKVSAEGNNIADTSTWNDDVVTVDNKVFTFIIPPTFGNYENFSAFYFNSNLNPYVKYNLTKKHISVPEGCDVSVEFYLSGENQEGESIYITPIFGGEIRPFNYGITKNAYLGVDLTYYYNDNEEAQTAKISFSLTPKIEKFVSTAVESIVSQGKNLIDDIELFGRLGWTLQSNGYWKGQYSTEFIFINDMNYPSAMTISLKYKEAENVTNNGTLPILMFYFYYTDGTHDSFSLPIKAKEYGNYYFTSKRNKTVSSVRLFYGSRGVFEIKDLMLNLGESPFTYEPYAVSKKVIPSEIINLEGYGDGLTKDICNSVDFDDFKYTRLVRRKAFDGTENWGGGESDFSPATFQYFVTIDDKTPTRDYEITQCTYFHNVEPPAEEQDVFVEFFDSRTIMFYTDIPSVEAWKSYLAELNKYGAPLTLLYRTEKSNIENFSQSYDINPVSIANGNVLVFNNEPNADMPNEIEYVKKAIEGEIQ